MLGGERASCRHAFDIGKQQAAGGERHDVLDIAQPQCRTLEAGQAGRYLSRRWHSERTETKDGCGDDRQRNDAERDWPSRQHTFAEHEQQDRGQPHGQYERTCLHEMPGECYSSLEKIVPAPGYAEQARQLGHRDGQSGTGFEPHKDAVTDQLDESAEPQCPGEQTKDRHRESREAGDLDIALRIACRHRSHRPGDHERNGGGRSDRQLARRSEQRVSEPAQEVAVHADLWRQSGKRRISQRHRDRVGGYRHTGNDVVRQPGSLVFQQPAGRWKVPNPCGSTRAIRRIRHARRLI